MILHFKEINDFNFYSHETPYLLLLNEKWQPVY